MSEGAEQDWQYPYDARESDHTSWVDGRFAWIENVVVADVVVFVVSLQNGRRGAERRPSKFRDEKKTQERN